MQKEEQQYIEESEARISKKEGKKTRLPRVTVSECKVDEFFYLEFWFRIHFDVEFPYRFNSFLILPGYINRAFDISLRFTVVCAKSKCVNRNSCATIEFSLFDLRFRMGKKRVELNFDSWVSHSCALHGILWLRRQGCGFGIV